MSTPASSTSTGAVTPKRCIESAILRMPCSVCALGLRGYSRMRSSRQRSTRSAGHSRSCWLLLLFSCTSTSSLSSHSVVRNQILTMPASIDATIMRPHRRAPEGLPQQPAVFDLERHRLLAGCAIADQLWLGIVAGGDDLGNAPSLAVA